MSNENTPQDECRRPAVGGPVERMVRPRWWRSDETMDYQIASGYGPSELALKVNELMDRGWTPAGGVAVEPASNGYAALYSQALTSTKESREAAARARDY